MANPAGELIRKYLAIHAHFIAIKAAVARRRIGDLLSAGPLLLRIPPSHGRQTYPDRTRRGRRDPRGLCPKHAIGVWWICELPRRACVAHMRIRAFLIFAAVLASPPQASSAPIDESPPLPRPRPAEAPSQPAPYDAAPAEQAKPEPAIDQACLDRLGAAGIEFEAVALPPAAKPGCAIETPVRLKAVKLAPQWITSIRLPDEPTLSCRFGERFGHWLRDLASPHCRRARGRTQVGSHRAGLRMPQPQPRRGRQDQRARVRSRGRCRELRAREWPNAGHQAQWG